MTTLKVKDVHAVLAPHNRAGAREDMSAAVYPHLFSQGNGYFLLMSHCGLPPRGFKRSASLTGLALLAMCPTPGSTEAFGSGGGGGAHIPDKPRDSRH